MLGHNSITLHRLNSAKNALESAVKEIDTTIREVNYDPTCSMSILLVKDALQILENCAKPARSMKSKPVECNCNKE